MFYRRNPTPTFDVPTDHALEAFVSLIENSSSHLAQDEYDEAERLVKAGAANWDEFKLTVLYITINHSI